MAPPPISGEFWSFIYVKAQYSYQFLVTFLRGRFNIPISGCKKVICEQTRTKTGKVRVGLAFRGFRTTEKIKRQDSLSIANWKQTLFFFISMTKNYVSMRKIVLRFYFLLTKLRSWRYFFSIFFTRSNSTASFSDFPVCPSFCL